MVIWSLLRALAGPVHQGRIEVWGVDGSRGAALGPSAGLFFHLALTGPNEGAALLERATARLCRRPAGEPSASAPLVILVLHEVVRWGPTGDERLHERLVSALDLLLDYGQAYGVVVVATAPSAGVDLADRFPQRITLTGSGGPRTDPPEVGRVSTASPTPMRVRVTRVNVREIATTAAAFPAPPHWTDAHAGDCSVALALEA